MAFNLYNPFPPAGDQPDAIRQLTEGILNEEKYQTLLGVTGSGKTFTVVVEGFDAAGKLVHLEKVLGN